MATHSLPSIVEFPQAFQKVEADITINSYPSTSTESSFVLTDPPRPRQLSTRGSTSTATCSIDDANSKTRVRKLKSSETKQAALCLAEAFKDDEMARYFTHTPDRAHCSDDDHWKLHLWIMEQLVKAHIVCGTVTAIGDNYDCVALWMPPGKTMDGIVPKLRRVLRKQDFERKLSKEGMARFFDEFIPKLHDAKLEVLGEKGDMNSWYLVYIGTKPGSRKRGYARKLIQHTLDKADKKMVPCYLESSHEANTKLYNSLGFVHDKFLDFTRDKDVVRLGLMTRQPQTHVVHAYAKYE